MLSNFYLSSHIVSNIVAVRDFLLNNNNLLADIVYVKLLLPWVLDGLRWIRNLHK